MLLQRGPRLRGARGILGEGLGQAIALNGHVLKGEAIECCGDRFESECAWWPRSLADEQVPRVYHVADPGQAYSLSEK